jgi:hypothetical protein
MFDTGCAKEIYSDFAQIVEDNMEKGPGVEIHLVASSAKDTVVGLDFQNSCVESVVYTYESDAHYRKSRRRWSEGREVCDLFGDGIVPFRSLCYWNDKTYPDGSPYITSIKIFHGEKYTHSDLLSFREVNQYIVQVLDDLPNEGGCT